MPPPSDSLPLPLTLAEAIRRAEGNNPNYLQAVNDLALSQLDRTDAWLSLLPSPHFTLLSTGMAWNRQTLGTDPFGNPIANPEARMVQSSSSTQRVGAGFMLDLQNLLNHRQRSAQVRERELGAAARRTDLHAQVARAFLEIDERERSLDLARDLLEKAMRIYEITDRMVRLARRDRLDLVSAELDVVEREAQIEGARSELIGARLALRNLLGDPTLKEFTLVHEPLQQRTSDALDEASLVEEALAQSPWILQAYAAQLRVAGTVDLQRSRWLPTLSVSMSAARQAFERGGSGAFLRPNPADEWSRNVSLQLNFPDLGQFVRIRNDSDRARLHLRNHAEAVREIEIALEQEVRGLLKEVRQIEGSLVLLARRAALAATRRELQLEAYALGRGGYSELQHATDVVGSSERAVLHSRYALERAWINLERVLGRPIEG